MLINFLGIGRLTLLKNLFTEGLEIAALVNEEVTILTVPGWCQAKIGGEESFVL